MRSLEQGRETFVKHSKRWQLVDCVSCEDALKQGLKTGRGLQGYLATKANSAVFSGNGFGFLFYTEF